MRQLWQQSLNACLLATATLFALSGTSMRAQTVAASAAPDLRNGGVAPRITEKIDEARRATLPGHVRPFLKLAADQGAADASQKTGALMLMLSRTPKQQADLDAFVDGAHNKNSASFHKWLTPAEFGARFQPADSDVQAVKTWLQSKGFTVLDVVPSKTYISFTGSVGQLQSAFHTQIHRFTLNGEAHMATINEPEIPAALAPVIGGINKLDNFSPKPLIQKAGVYRTDKKTGKTTLRSDMPHSPSFNNPDSPTGLDYLLGPQDFYTVYNESPLLNAGITGAGQTIAVIEEVQVDPADVTSFRSQFGLPAYPSTPNATDGGVNYFIGSSAGLNGYASCFAPVSQSAGDQSGEESEADLDLQWSGAVAPKATVDFVACGGTATDGDGAQVGSYGTDHAAEYIVNYLAGSVVAASMSYGECEADMTSSNTTGVGFYTNLWQQYAAEGITAIVSSGDGGAEQCYQGSRYASNLPPSVNGLGSSAYNVSAGGTDFGDLYESANYSTTPVTTWWNATNGPGYSSAATYIPETTWSGYCSNPVFGSYLQAEGSTFLGTDYTPSGLCSNSTSISDGYTAVAGGAGGISTFNAIPVWQSVYGVGKNSVSSTFRNLPDVSLFAANGFWGHALPYCESDYVDCDFSNADNADSTAAGGTSFVAPQLAGFMALVSQKTGQSQGQANYTFYNLAAQEYGTATTAASSLTGCSGSAAVNGARPPASCYFYDVSNDMFGLQGLPITPGIYQPCRVSSNVDCYKGTGTTYGVNTVPGTTATDGILGYTASPGYDDATGLGSLNIYGIVEGWNNASPAFPSTTSISSNSSSINLGDSVTLTASVVATGRGGAVAPAGTVTFYIGSTSGTSLGTASITSGCTGTGASVSCSGTATLNVLATSLAVGDNSIIASFGGDGANDAPSVSDSTTVTVTNPSSISLSTNSLTYPSTGTGMISASQSVIVTNTGQAAVSIASIAVTGPNASSFVFLNTCGATLAGGASCTIHGHLNPTAAGPLTASIVITDSDSGSPQTVALSGTGVSSGSASLSATSLTYPATGIGLVSASQSVVVTNPGSLPLTIYHITVTGPNASSFVFLNDCGKSLAAGATCTIHGHLTPTTTGPLTATLTITGNSSTLPQTIALSGTGVTDGTASLSGNSLTYGPTAVGSLSASQSITLTNTGGSSLTLYQIVLGGTNASSFTFQNNCSYKIAPGASCTIHGHFNPTAVGPASATITITGSSASLPQNISVSGSGGISE